MYKFKSYFFSCLNSLNKLPLLIKIPLLLFLTLHLGRFAIYHTVYGSPFTKYFDVEGRKILFTKEKGGLYLLSFYNCNSKTYKPYSNSIKSNFGRNMCGEEILINPEIENDGFMPPRNISSAVLDDNTIVWARSTVSPYYIIYQEKISRNENNEYSLNRTIFADFKQFDLAKYAEDLRNGKKVLPPSAIQDQTGLIWNKPFLVENGKIVFYDAIVSKIDNEKPLEATFRRWEVGGRGDASYFNESRGSLNIAEYNYRFKKNKSFYGDYSFGWELFSLNPNLLGNLYEIRKKYYPFSNLLAAETKVPMTYESDNLKMKKSSQTYFSSGPCNTSWGPLPCAYAHGLRIDVSSKKYDKSYIFRDGRIAFFQTEPFEDPRGYINMSAVSQEEDILAFSQSEHTHLLHIPSGGLLTLPEWRMFVNFIK